MVRPLSVLIALCTLLIAAPAAAQGATRYVVPGGLGAAPCSSGNPCGLPQGIAAAATDDTVQLSAGAYNLGNTPLSITKRITVAGDPGAAAPSITAGAGAAIKLTAGASDATLRHLRITNTVFAGAGITADAGLKLYDVGVAVGYGECAKITGAATIQDSTFTQGVAGPSTCLGVIGKASLLRVTVNASKSDAFVTSVILIGADSVLDQSSISSGGAGLSLGQGTIRRTSISAVTAAASMRGTVTDALLRATGANGIALLLGQGLTTVVRGVTAIATGTNSVGIKATAATFNGTTGAQLDGKNLIARGTKLDVEGETGAVCQPSPPCADGLGTLTYSNVTSYTPSTITTGAGMQSGDPKFVSGSDLRLRTGSPAIDAGTADAKNGTRDLNGLLRPQNGKFDLGAYEYPKINIVLNPGDPPPDVTPDPGTPSDPGSPADPGTPGPGADATAPVLSRFSLSRSRFRAAGTRTATTAKARAGTRVRFTLSEPATVRLRVLVPGAGRRSGTQCVKATKQLRKARRCTLYRTAITLTRSGVGAGPHAVAFSGRTKKRTLKPGKYRLSATATDATGNVSAPRSAAFTVVRR